MDIDKERNERIWEGDARIHHLFQDTRCGHHHTMTKSTLGQMDRSKESGIVKKHQHEHLPAFLASLGALRAFVPAVERTHQSHSTIIASASSSSSSDEEES